MPIVYVVEEEDWTGEGGPEFLGVFEDEVDAVSFATNRVRDAGGRFLIEECITGTPKYIRQFMLDRCPYTGQPRYRQVWPVLIGTDSASVPNK